MDDEDDSVRTASEPAEPLTPKSHASEGQPFSHHLRHEEQKEKGPASVPVSAVLQAAPRPLHLSAHSAPIVSLLHQPQQKAQHEKVGLGQKVGFFVRNRLHRSRSRKDTSSAPPVADLPVEAFEEVRSTIKTNYALNGNRRHSFVLPVYRSERPSSLATPPTSQSPPTKLSSSPRHTDARPRLEKPTASFPALSGTPHSRPGITWAGSGHGKPTRPGWGRRRSASTDRTPQLGSNNNNDTNNNDNNNNNNKPTVGMVFTFSKPPVEGIGAKARRLSMSLPSDFIIDWCELDREFKHSSLMPGKKKRLLGKGATSEVRIMARRGPSSKDEVLVAVKEFRERDADETEQDYVLKIKSEYSIAKSLHHPNIVETVRLCTHRGRWNHVMEFCTYGEVYSLVERKLFSEGPHGFYSDDDRLCFFKQLLRGIGFLHSHGIAHRDIKLENLLLDKDGRLKISDFGVAEVFSGEHPGLRASGGECGKNMQEVRLSAPGICGSLPYIAPEVLEKGQSYDPRPLDVWSSAIVYLTMTFGGCPWKVAKTEFEYYAWFKKGWDRWLAIHPSGVIFDGPDGQPKCGKLFNLIDPPPLRRLMLKMLHPMPNRRITVRRILETDFVQNIGCCCPDAFDESQASSATPKFNHRHIPPKPEHKHARKYAFNELI